jgi:hypothetical protein
MDEFTASGRITRMENVMPNMQEVDPFLDDSMGVPLDTRTGPQHIADLTKIAEEHPELVPNVDPVIEPAPVHEPIVEPILPIEEDKPEIYDVDGGQVIIEKTSTGWKGTLKGKRTEVFKGKNKNELLANVLAGKLQASKQIDNLNKELKLGRVTAAPEPAPVRTPAFQKKTLTADDIFQIKTALADNPDLALETWFQKKYGKSFEQLTALLERVSEDSQKGVEASEELTVEGVSKAFLAANPDYIPNNPNSSNMWYWLCVHKLRRQPTINDNFGTISAELVKKNLYTVENLTEAFEDLKEAGLLELESEDEPVQDIPAPAPPAPAPPQVIPATPPNPRIANVKREVRGGLGIRPGSIQTAPPELDVERAPSADELENMSDQQLAELKAATDRYRIQQKYGSSRR